MTLQELIDKLGMNMEENALIQFNGKYQQPKDFPIQDFAIDKISVNFEGLKGCDVIIIPEIPE